MTERHLAQFSIARVKYPLDDPRMANGRTEAAE